MSRIVIFGAGGRAGRQAVAEARRRGHEVTAVVRDLARHAGEGAGGGPVEGEPADGVHHGPVDGQGVEGGTLFAVGDITDASSVAALAAGHDAAIHTAAVYGPGTDPDAFFTGAANALVSGLRTAGVRRLVVAGLSVLLPGRDGVRRLDAPEFPAQFRPFCLAHAAGLDILRAAGDAPDWVYVSPAGDFDHQGPRTGGYTVREYGDDGARISYADFAVALLDEATAPRHHREHLAVT